MFELLFIAAPVAILILTVLHFSLMYTVNTLRSDIVHNVEFARQETQRVTDLRERIIRLECELSDLEDA